jgi:ubiquinone/menaquinone biosynthesis C-methylase UbiE
MWRPNQLVRRDTGPSLSPPMTNARAAELGSGRPHDTDRPDIETASDRYATRRFRGAAGRWLLEQQSIAVDALLDRIDRPVRALEVGGGHAQITPLLLARGHDVTVHGSSDVCFTRLEMTRRAHPERVTRCVASLWQLPFADASFDVVVAVRLLGHVAEWRALLAEMTRVSSRYVIIEFARKSNMLALQSLRDAVFSLKHRVEGTTRPFFAYPEDAIASELRAHGFRRVETLGQFALPMVMHRMLRAPSLSAALEGSLRAVGVRDGVRSPAVLLAEREPSAEAREVVRGSPTVAAARVAAAAAAVMLPPPT